MNMMDAYVVCRMLVLLQDVIEEDKGFLVQHTTLTEINTIWRYSHLKIRYSGILTKCAPVCGFHCKENRG